MLSLIRDIRVAEKKSFNMFPIYHRDFHGAFLQWGYPHSWMVFGKIPSFEMDDKNRGTMTSWTPPHESSGLSDCGENLSDPPGCRSNSGETSPAAFQMAKNSTTGSKDS